jgi:hypothetical protein
MPREAKISLPVEIKDALARWGRSSALVWRADLMVSAGKRTTGDMGKNAS